MCRTAAGRGRRRAVDKHAETVGVIAYGAYYRNGE
jgi:hypothetical protein